MWLILDVTESANMAISPLKHSSEVTVLYVDALQLLSRGQQRINELTSFFSPNWEDLQNNIIYLVFLHSSITWMLSVCKAICNLGQFIFPRIASFHIYWFSSIKTDGAKYGRRNCLVKTTKKLPWPQSTHSHITNSFNNTWQEIE